MKFPVYNLQGEKVKEIELTSRIFGVKIKPEVVHQVTVAQLANTRKVLASTKDKSEVRGGGKKPWRQKGTGRARHGSIRSPLWRGGGITFGPTTDRNFSLRVNKKQKQLALAMCLSDRASDNSLVVLDKLELASGKTKDLNNLLGQLQEKIADWKNKKKFLIISADKNNELVRASLNLPQVEVILADSLNCLAVLKHDAVLADMAAIDKIDKWYQKIKAKNS
jgi:large subunit ribosomal protein L4